MARIERITPLYVDKMPEGLENGILYIAPQYKIALHNCCCGCGEEVSTPLTDTEYQLQDINGEISLHPSIGNHDFDCRSHYVIRHGQVIWANVMTREAIDYGRARDRILKSNRHPRGLQKFVRGVVDFFKRLLG